MKYTNKQVQMITIRENGREHSLKLAILDKLKSEIERVIEDEKFPYGVQDDLWDAYDAVEKARRLYTTDWAAKRAAWEQGRGIVGYLNRREVE